jgi:hypothetical protein
MNFKITALVFSILISNNILYSQSLTNRDVWGQVSVDDIVIMQPSRINCNSCNTFFEKPYRLVFNGWTDTITTTNNWIGSISQTFDCQSLRVIDTSNDTVVYYSYNNQPDQVYINNLEIYGIDSNYNPLSYLYPIQQSNTISHCNSLSSQVVYNTDSNSNASTYLRSIGAEGKGEITRCDSVRYNSGFSTYTITDQVVQIKNGDTCTTSDKIKIIEDVNSAGLKNINVYDFNINDEYLYSYYYGSHNPSTGGWLSSTDYEFIKIISKQYISDSVKYTANIHYVDYDENEVIINDTMIYNKVITYPIIGNIEINFPQTYLYSDGINTIYKENTCGYNQIYWNYITDDIYNSDTYYKYGEGLGLTEYRKNMSGFYSRSDRLIYFKKNGVECGDYFPLNYFKTPSDFIFEINPTITDSEINLIVSSNQRNACNLNITDLTGKVIKDLGSTVFDNSNPSILISVADLSAGFYIFKITNQYGYTYAKKFYKI